MLNYIEWTTDGGDPRICFIPDTANRGDLLVDLGIIEPLPDGGYVVARCFSTTDDIINEVMNESI